MSDPLPPAVVTALAQQAAESPAHLDPVLVHQVCQEWQIGQQAASLQRCIVEAAYQDKLKAEQQRDAALAERDHERLRYDGMRADRDDWRKRCEDEQAAHALTADRYVVANRRGDGFRAALTEARRVLREVVAWADKGCPDGCPVCLGQDAHAPDCALVAVLAQEEK